MTCEIEHFKNKFLEQDLEKRSS